MHLTKISIDGFGVFRDHQIDDLRPGMVLVFGPNEAGKSTLLAFLRGVLFGFPRRSKNRRLAYPPLAGGRHGGRIFAQTAAGPVGIEREVGRRAGRIVLESPGDGPGELTDTEFQQLIGGIDEQTFNTVFAFTLDELRDFDTLTGEQVKARIFAAGLGGAGPSARDVTARIERRLGRLLKPRSFDGQINSILHEIGQREAELAAARSLTEDYPALLEEKAILAAELRRSGEREAELRAIQTQSERLLELWPAWVDIDKNRRELDDLEPVDDFIPDAIRRLDEAKDRLSEAESGLAGLLDKKARNDDEVVRLREDAFDGLWALAPKIEEQVATLPQYKDLIERKNEAQTRVALTDDRLRRRLREVDPRLDETALEGVDTSLPRFEEVRRLRSGLDAAAQQTTLALHSSDAAREARKRAEAERDDERQALERLPQVDEEVLAERGRHLRLLRADVADLRTQEAALEGRLMAAADLAAPPAAPARPSFWVGGLSAALGVALAVIAAVLRILDQAGTVVIGVGVLAFLCIAVAVGSLLWRARVGGASRDSAERAAVLRREKQEQEAMYDAIKNIEARLTPIATALGITDLRDAHEVEVVEAGLSEAQQQVAVVKEQTVAAERAEARFKKACEDEGLAEARLKTARDEESARRTGFQVAMAEWGLPDDLSPEGAEEYLRGLAAAKELAEHRQEEVADLEQVIAGVDGWRGTSTAILMAARTAVALRAGLSEEDLLEEEPDEEGRQLDIEATLLALAEACGDERAVRERITELDEEDERLDEQIREARTAVATAQEALADLFGRASVEDEEGFLDRFATYQRRQELTRSVELGEQTLVKSVGRGEQAEQIRAALAEGDLAQWQADADRARSQLEELGSTRDEAIKQEGDVERRLSELEVSADVPALESAFEGLQTMLHDSMQEWRINKLAAHLIAETLTRFTLERQPQVLSEASEMLRRVTGGAYVKVRLSTEEESVVVEAPDGQVKYPDQLSRGTAEQLYLCLRLGLADEFARRAEPMPLIMDEVLVNFDSARRERTAALLLEFAKRHQVFFFTCHEDIVQLMQSIDPTVRTISL